MSYAKATFRRGRMNKTEQRYAAHLHLLKHAGEVLEYAYEPMRFRLADNAFYTPDFRVVMADGTCELHEIKGAKKGHGKGYYVTETGQLRIKVAAEMHPFRFVKVWPAGAGAWKSEEV